MQQQSTLNFPTLVASSIHDLKNSLATIRELLGNHAKNCNSANKQDFVKLELESRRMNNNLMHLLILYKMDISRFSLAIDEHPIADLFDEIIAQRSPAFSSQEITLELDYDESLSCYCDFALISNAICTILDNAQRYTKSRIILSCKREKGYISFSVEDNGEGYPENMLNNNFPQISSIDFYNSSTGLGMFFVLSVAQMHIDNQKRGYINFDNNSRIGGARFTLFLP
jgi:signal transduction histidine kinase